MKSQCWITVLWYYRICCTSLPLTTRWSRFKCFSQKIESSRIYVGVSFFARSQNLHWKLKLIFVEQVLYMRTEVCDTFIQKGKEAGLSFAERRWLGNMVVSNLDKEAVHREFGLLPVVRRSHLLTGATIFNLSPSHATVLKNLNKSNCFQSIKSI